MIDATTRALALRVFEQTLQRTLETWVPAESGVVACTLPDADGSTVILARYRVYPDGRFVRLEEEAAAGG
jgi:hypothetical protein